MGRPGRFQSWLSVGYCHFIRKHREKGRRGSQKDKQQSILGRSFSDGGALKRETGVRSERERERDREGEGERERERERERESEIS